MIEQREKEIDYLRQATGITQNTINSVSPQIPSSSLGPMQRRNLVSDLSYMVDTGKREVQKLFATIKQ